MLAFLSEKAFGTEDGFQGSAPTLVQITGWLRTHCCTGDCFDSAGNFAMGTYLNGNFVSLRSRRMLRSSLSVIDLYKMENGITCAVKTVCGRLVICWTHSGNGRRTSPCLTSHCGCSCGGSWKSEALRHRFPIRERWVFWWQLRIWVLTLVR